MSRNVKHTVTNTISCDQPGCKEEIVNVGTGMMATLVHQARDEGWCVSNSYGGLHICPEHNYTKRRE